MSVKCIPFARNSVNPGDADGSLGARTDSLRPRWEQIRVTRISGRYTDARCGTDKRRAPPSAKYLPRIYASTPDLGFCVCDSIPGGGLYCIEKVHAATGRSPVVDRCCLPASRPRPIRWPTNSRYRSATSSTNERHSAAGGRHLEMPLEARTLSRHASKVGVCVEALVRIWCSEDSCGSHRQKSPETVVVMSSSEEGD